jgi:hypothetical protein
VISKIQADGTIINSVTIRRYNHSSDAVNGNFMRVLVPLGSVITKAEGFLDKAQHASTADGFTTDPDLLAWDQNTALGNARIRSEAGKTAVTGWLNTQPQSESVITLEYIIPFRIQTNFLNPAQTHSLLFQKQPGTKRTQVNVEWVSDHKNLANNTTTKFQSNGQTDSLWYITVGK